MNDNTQFIDPSKKSLYGKEGGQFWIGKIVAYADQEDQLDDGFGWRYKVRILGDNSDTDEVEDSYLTYATVLLPTTAGTGAAYKLRSVRLSQGDMVFGVRGGGTAAPKFIIGAFPRTTKTINHKDERGNPTYGKTGKFDTPKGFYGSLKENSTLSGEFNEQIGPKTPSTDPVGPKNYSKAEKKEPSDKAKELGVIAGGDENVNVEEKLTPKKKIKTAEEYIKDKEDNVTDAVNNKETLDNVNEAGLNGEINPNDAIDAHNVAVKQGIEEESVAKDNIKKLEEKLPKYKKTFIEGVNDAKNPPFDSWEKAELAKLASKDKASLRGDGKIALNLDEGERFQARTDVLKEINRIEKSIKFDTKFEGQTLALKDSIGEKTYNIPKASEEKIQKDKRRLLYLTKQLKYIEDGGTVQDRLVMNPEWAKLKYTDEFPNG